MSDLSQERVKEIARGLSKAQREALLRQVGSRLTTRRLYEAGFFEAWTYYYGATEGVLSHPTSLGQAVAHLIEAEKLEGAGNG